MMTSRLLHRGAVEEALGALAAISQSRRAKDFPGILHCIAHRAYKGAACRSIRALREKSVVEKIRARLEENLAKSKVCLSTKNRLEQEMIFLYREAGYQRGEVSVCRSISAASWRQWPTVKGKVRNSAS